jgi:hypothetical protein
VVDGEDAVQARRDKQPLHLRRHAAQDETAVRPARTALRFHDHAEARGITRVQFGQVEHEVSAAGVDRGVEDGTGVRRAPCVEASPDGEMSVVALDVHACSPWIWIPVIVRSVSSVGGQRIRSVTPQLTIRHLFASPSVSEPIPNSLLWVIRAESRQ